MASASVWFVGRKTYFQGGLIACSGATLDFLECKEEQGHFTVFLPSIQFPVMSWEPLEGGITVLEVYVDGIMLHAESDKTADGN